MNDNNKPIIFEPLLTYYESEDENETKKNKIKKDKIFSKENKIQII